MIPKQNTEHGMVFARLSKTQKIPISKVKKQSDVGHNLRQLGNHSQRICFTRSVGEQGILCGSIVSFGSKNSLSKISVSSWFLLHDNERPHTAVSIKQFLAKQGIPD
jgi:hypothetical protein